MLEFGKPRENAFVDAIEGGKIVKVSEDYAKREGLLILRKAAPIIEQTKSPRKEEEARKNKGFIGMEDLRKPLSSKNNELLKELVENFHWTLVQKRKVRGLNRKKVADAIGERELSVKMIENGVLPVNNFVLLNKLESYYGINLRKNKVASSKQPLREIIDFNNGKADSASKIPRWLRKEGNKNQGSLTSYKKEENAVELLDDSTESAGENAGKKKGESNKDSIDIDLEQL